MIAEAPKYWPQIKSLLETREEARKKRVEGEIAKEKQRRQEESALRDQMFEMVGDVFTELKDNAPQIEGASEKGIVKEPIALQKDEHGQSLRGSLRLRWGNKFGPSPEERRILDQYQRPSVVDPSNLVPDRILLEDYQYVHINFYHGFMRIQHLDVEYPYEVITNDPTDLLTTLGELVESPPSRVYPTWKEKGADYWREPQQQPLSLFGKLRTVFRA